MNNKNVNKNINEDDIRSNRSIRMNKFQVEEYKQYTTTVRNAQMSQKKEFFIIIQKKEFKL